MAKYKDKIKTMEEAKAFHATVKELIKNTSGTYGSVAKIFTISSDMLRQRELETYKILSRNGGSDPLEFKESIKKEKSPETVIIPTEEKEGSITLTIPKDYVKYLSYTSLEKNDVLILKVNNQTSIKYHPSIELIGSNASIENRKEKKHSSKISKIKKKERENLQKNNVVSV